MIRVGYALVGEEHGPVALVKNAVSAERAGFDFLVLTDHWHPWLDAQGESSFVWTVIGALSKAIERVSVGTGVTCPLFRLHPAMVAQAAATAAALLEGRFFLGVGTGGRINEHILGQRWPPAGTRLEMLREAVEIMRALWSGDEISHHGRFYVLEQARLYTLPEAPPPIYMAAEGPRAVATAGDIADGLITPWADERASRGFRAAAGDHKPRVGWMSVCVARSEAEAIETAMERWPIAGLAAPLFRELATPAQFERAVADVPAARLRERLVLGADPEAHLSAIGRFVDAGFDHVYVHQIGTDQQAFFRLYEQEILPSLREH